MRLITNLKSVIKKIPGSIVLYQCMVKCCKLITSRMQSTEGIFTEIFKDNAWRGNCSVSGGGSDLEQTKTIVKELPLLLKDFEIATMLDIPCGDFFWMKTVDLKGINYIGAEIVAEIVERNKQLYQKNNISFNKLNLLSNDLPKVDLIFCRDCLVHFSFSDIFMALKNICKSRSTYLLTTTFYERKENCDIKTGKWRVLNFEEAPFYFPPPLSLLVEHCTQKNSRGEYKDKSLGLWKISDIEKKLTQKSPRFL